MTDAKAKDEQPNPQDTGEKIEVSKAEYDKLAAEAKEYKDKFIRLFAEFENARKRNERERMEFVKYANEGIISDFLNILDDLERSVETAKVKHQDYDAFLKGMEIVMKRIHEMLKAHDVQPVETLGKTFDPHCHEILMQEESDKHQEHEVIEEYQKGYRIGERVIRTAKVKVATPPSSENNTSE